MVCCDVFRTTFVANVANVVNENAASRVYLSDDRVGVECVLDNGCIAGSKRYRCLDLCRTSAFVLACLILSLVGVGGVEGDLLSVSQVQALSWFVCGGTAFILGVRTIKAVLFAQLD